MRAIYRLKILILLLKIFLRYKIIMILILNIKLFSKIPCESIFQKSKWSTNKSMHSVFSTRMYSDLVEINRWSSSCMSSTRPRVTKGFSLPYVQNSCGKTLGMCFHYAHLLINKLDGKKIVLLAFLSTFYSISIWDIKNVLFFICKI